MRVHAGVVAAGAGGQPAAERGQLERLREVAQRVAVRAELGLQRRPEDAGLDPGGARRGIDVDDLIQRPEVDRHRAGEAVADGALDAADDGGPAAVRDRRHALRAAPVEHGDDVGLRRREGHDVGWVRQITVDGAHDVPIGLSEGVAGAVLGRRGAPSGERTWRLDAGRTELQALEGGGREQVDLGAEPLGQPSGEGADLVVAEGLVLVSPSPPGPSTCRHLPSLPAYHPLG